MLKSLICVVILAFVIFGQAHEFPTKQEPILPKLDFTCTICVILSNGLIHGVSREREALKKALAQVCTVMPREFNTTVLINFL
jgi:hypothetical protein